MLHLHYWILLMCPSQSSHGRLFQRPAQELIQHMNQKYMHGNTLLHMAVFQHDLLLIQDLLQHGTEIDAQNMDGDTALIIASRLDDRDAVNLLLECGANTHIANNKNE